MKILNLQAFEMHSYVIFFSKYLSGLFTKLDLNSQPHLRHSLKKTPTAILISWGPRNPYLVMSPSLRSVSPFLSPKPQPIRFGPASSLSSFSAIRKLILLSFILKLNDTLYNNNIIHLSEAVRKNR